MGLGGPDISSLGFLAARGPLWLGRLTFHPAPTESRILQTDQFQWKTLTTLNVSIEGVTSHSLTSGLFEPFWAWPR